MMRKEIVTNLGKESGTALIIALVMIVVLTLIGLSSTFTSIFETKLSGLKRESTNAYYAADAAAQVVFNNDGNFQPHASDEAIADPATDPKIPQDLKGDPINRIRPAPVITLPSGSGFADSPQITIYHLTREGGEGLGYSWDTYVIGAVGKDQMPVAGTKSQCTVRQKWLLRGVSETE